MLDNSNSAIPESTNSDNVNNEERNTSESNQQVNSRTPQQVETANSETITSDTKSHPTKAIVKNILNILNKRKLKLPIVDEQLTNWNHTSVALDNMVASCRELLQSGLLDEFEGDRVNKLIDRERIKKLRSGIHRAQGFLDRLKSRISRDTINIAVIGRARAGKSTFLQKVTGLGNEIIPAAAGNPVTAVGSTIQHENSGKRRAEVYFYSFRQFKEKILSKYLSALGHPDLIPQTIEEFKRQSVPQFPNLNQSQNALVQRVTKLYRQRDNYIDLLDKKKREITNLIELRPYIAYDNEDGLERGGTQPGMYHAVETARVYCRFEYGVERLVVMDLPGLGEVDPSAQRHHVERLSKEIDFVLFIRRVTDESGYWTEEDNNILSLMEKSNPEFSNVNRFFYFVINKNDSDTENDANLVNGLISNITEIGNSHQETISSDQITTCMITRDDVVEEVMKPALDYLIEQLPILDSELLNGIKSHCSEVFNDLKQFFSEGHDLYKHLSASLGSPDIEVSDRASELHKQLANSVYRTVKELHDDVSSIETTTQPANSNEIRGRGAQGRTSTEALAPVDPRISQNRVQLRKSPPASNSYESRILEIADYAKIKFRDSMTDHFSKKLLEAYIFNASHLSFLEAEYNRARIEIDRSFKTFDRFLTAQVGEVHHRIFEALRTTNGQTQPLAELFGEVEGLPGLLKLFQKSGCEGLSDLLKDFLALTITVNSHFLPEYCKFLYRVQLILNGDFNDKENGTILGNFPATALGAESTKDEFEQRVDGAIDEISTSMSSLCDKPPLIIYNTALRFFDEFFRYERSRKEFIQFCLHYKAIIWSDLGEAQRKREIVDRLKSSFDEAKTHVSRLSAI